MLCLFSHHDGLTPVFLLFSRDYRDIQFVPLRIFYISNITLRDLTLCRMVWRFGKVSEGVQWRYDMVCSGGSDTHELAM
jgi:hypothetical protein